MVGMSGIDARPWDPEETYYVIIGWGLTAAVNYTTLLATNRSRLGELPVLFIGEPERWSRYAPLAMGQWPGVLAAPAFRQKLRSSPQHTFLSSQDFAGAIARQWRHLHRRRPFHALQDQVDTIDPLVYPFLIHCAGQRRPVKAAAIDVCGGPGPPRCLCDHQVDPNLRPYPGAAPGPGGWRPLETGESFLENGTPVAGGQRVAVVGGGPTAAWCVERALAAECEVLWVSDDRLNPAFVSSLRNDGLAQQPLMRHRQYHVSVVAQLVYPASPRLRLRRVMKSRRSSTSIPRSRLFSETNRACASALWTRPTATSDS